MQEIDAHCAPYFAHFVHLILVRPNAAPNSWMIFSGTAVFLAGNICLLILWSVALLRTGLGSLYIIVFTAILSVVFSAVQLVLYYNPPFVFQTLGRDGYQIFYYAFVWTQILTVFINIIGIALLVRWICRVHASRGYSQPV
jgi:hypothetical protein